ncbi:MAG: PhzF family phenazine biosynthesis protein [Myxococcales bacterium]|nr:PhzF family phenazine biosynthesis protein [Myxococcales bacterium]MCB9578738.1 PhzF family phenazine biosynthesis protein [Polyangiaceae bacterium]
MTVPITIVDAFTSVPFRGNPAAVCVLSSPRDGVWMQDVAREMSLSETAFVSPRSDGFDLRWFTPAVEVELCGHATLASAHVLWQTGTLPLNVPARFLSKSGWLEARRSGERIELDFPALSAERCEAPEGLAAALDVTPTACFRSRYDVLVELPAEHVVRNLAPDFRRLGGVKVRGVIATAPADDAKYDFVSRFFAPGAGVDEDPVTGSAHCVLGPFWGARLNKTDVLGFQASSRGGEVSVSLRGDRVALLGHAVTVMRGELVV